MISLNHDEYTISYLCNHTNIIIFKFYSKNNLKSSADNTWGAISFLYNCWWLSDSYTKLPFLELTILAGATLNQHTTIFFIEFIMHSKTTFFYCLVEQAIFCHFQTASKLNMQDFKLLQWDTYITKSVQKF